LTWSVDHVDQVDLPCDGWRAEKGRYVFVGRVPEAAGVQRIVAGAGSFLVRVSGGAFEIPGDAPRFVEAKLGVGEEEYCARFEGFRESRGAQILSRGRAAACRHPRPNFLVINLDDIRFDGLDAMPVVQSELVGGGIDFANSFVPFSVCCSSRASLLTGLYALRHGTRHVAGPLGGADTFRESGRDQETIAVWLRAAGYRTGLFGKYLNAYDVTEQDKGPGGTFYVPPGWDRWWAFVSPEHYGGVHGATYVIVDETSTKTTYEDHTSDAEYSTGLSAEEMRAFIAASVEQGAPFFAYWAPYAGHGDTPTLLPEPADRHLDAFDGIELWRPPSWDEADVSDKPRFVQSQQEFIDDETGSGPIIPFLVDAIRQRQYETLLSVDEQVGLLLEHLRGLGVERDTVILLTSDNGLGWGEHHTWGGKECAYEECVRVPMLLRYPRRVAPGVVEREVLNIDIAPTVAALADVEPPIETDGESLEAAVRAIPSRHRRGEFLLERWRADRAGRLEYGGQVADGDRIRVYFGPPRQQPRDARVFEFDSGGGVSPDAVAVAIGADADATFFNFNGAVTRSIPRLRAFLNTASDSLAIDPRDPLDQSVYFWEETDQLGVIDPEDPIPEYFGLRDVAGGFTWVEYETGERELYDLTLDPDQLQNRADDPVYQSIAGQMAARLADLMAEIEARD
jgi:arylsulfatase A-like enzyme